METFIKRIGESTIYNFIFNNWILSPIIIIVHISFFFYKSINNYFTDSIIFIVLPKLIHYIWNRCLNIRDYKDGAMEYRYHYIKDIIYHLLWYSVMGTCLYYIIYNKWYMFPFDVLLTWGAFRSLKEHYNYPPRISEEKELCLKNAYHDSI